ncbi:MAG: ATP-binding protein [Oscillospiraceae bacterium]|nr:ATP-binding protein [Oscillospiraceae bacterium]
MEQIIDELKESGISDAHIIYVNFEFIEFEELTDYKKLNEYIKERIRDDDLYYLFFDEIQNVKNFEKVINSLRASQKASIFITGSNSRLLSDELSTVLSGRYVAFKINPLSFKEIIELLDIKEITDEIIYDYMKWGSLPNRFEFKEEKDIKNYLHGVFDSIILRDVVQRLKIRDVLLFNLILQYIIDTIGREFSSENIIKFLKSEGRDISTQTVYSYLDGLCRALLIRKAYRYDVHGKAVLRTLNKYYVTDLGIAQIKNHKKSIDWNYALENIIYNELLIKGYDVYTGKTKKGEIDFVAIKTNRKIYIQAAYTISTPETKAREFGAYENVDDNYPKYVITLDKPETEINGINQINLLKFLLEDYF